MTHFDRRDHRGWDVLTLATDEVRLEVLPGLGGTIWSLARASDGAQVLWNPPWSLRRVGSPSLPGSAETVMLDDWPGGWQTVFPNAGDATAAHGVELGFDGEARLCGLDWDHTDDSVVMTGRLARSPFELTKTITLRGREATLTETVRNVGGEAIEAVWGQQLTFGRDLLGPDTVVDAGASVVHPDPAVSFNTHYDDVTPWPRSHGSRSMINLRRLPDAQSGETRLAYLTDFSDPAMRIARPGLTVDLSWDGEAWPHAWYSLEAGGRRGYPWFQRGHFLTLTPCSGWPAHGVHEARRVSGSAIWIEPDTVRTSHATVAVS